MKTDQDIDSHVAGDTGHITIVVEDGDSDVADEPKDLTGASVSWGLAESRGGETLIEKSTDGGGIVIVGDASNGEIRIELTPSETEPLQGDHYHEAEVTDSGGNVSTVTTGSIYVLPQTV